MLLLEGMNDMERWEPISNSGVSINLYSVFGAFGSSNGKLVTFWKKTIAIVSNPLLLYDIDST